MINNFKSTLLAGAAEVDITPELGIQLAGDIGRYRPAEEIIDRLYARIIVLEDDNEKMCLISLDLLSIGNLQACEVRKKIVDSFGIKFENIMIHAVQNHAAPSLGHLIIKDESKMPEQYPWLMAGDNRYNGPTERKILSAVEEAVRSLRPATIYAGRGIDGRCSFNRRFIMRDGTVKCQPRNGDPEILQPEGIADPEVGVMKFMDSNQRDIAIILNYTCHPCHGYPKQSVISDWPGIWAEKMKTQCSAGCVPFVINGCCGNIHYNNVLDPEPIYDYKRMADKLTETSSKVLMNLEEIDVDDLAFAGKILRLPLREMPGEELTAAQHLIKQYPEPKWLDSKKECVDREWIFAKTILDLNTIRNDDPLCDYEIQVFRIGDTALVSVMGEPFVEAQLRIKAESPATYTFVAHLCNGYAGYIPTEKAVEIGGTFETRISNGSKFYPGALDDITNAALELLKQCFQR